MKIAKDKCRVDLISLRLCWNGCGREFARLTIALKIIIMKWLGMKNKLEFLIFNLLFACFLFVEAMADSNVVVSSWQEKSYLNSEGKSAEILIKAAIKNLPKNYVMTSFGIDFGSENKISVKNVTCDGAQVKFDFVNGALKVEFAKQKINGDEFALYISYNEKYKDIHKYLRQEAILVPPFAAGADAKVVIEFPWYLESATLNYNVKKVGNSFVYQSKVPVSGVMELIKLTPSQSAWSVLAKTKVRSNAALKDVTIEIANYFNHPRQKVENRSLLASVVPAKTTKENNRYLLKFDSEKREILIENRANIFTGKSYGKVVGFNPGEYLRYNQEDRELLENILYKIRQSPKYAAFPLYAKIGNFVYDFIKYDRSYVGKRPSVRQILNNPIGVCTEYSRLFNELARVAGIPSMVLSGVACGEYNSCEGHVWNMIYYNNQWLEVDPTWNLMSGIVSSSHVYFSNEDQSSVGTQYPGDGREVRLELDATISPLN